MHCTKFYIIALTAAPSFMTDRPFMSWLSCRSINSLDASWVSLLMGAAYKQIVWLISWSMANNSLQ